MNQECTKATPDTVSGPTPADCLLDAITAAGFAVGGVPDDLTLDQVGHLSQELLRQSTWAHAPEVAACLDNGDVAAAATAFLAWLDRRRAS